MRACKVNLKHNTQMKITFYKLPSDRLGVSALCVRDLKKSGGFLKRGPQSLHQGFSGPFSKTGRAGNRLALGPADNGCPVRPHQLGNVFGIKMGLYECGNSESKGFRVIGRHVLQGCKELPSCLHPGFKDNGKPQG